MEGTGDDEADVSSQEEVLYILYEDRTALLARTRLELAISYRIGVISQIQCGTSTLCISDKLARKMNCLVVSSYSVPRLDLHPSCIDSASASSPVLSRPSET